MVDGILQARLAGKRAGVVISKESTLWYANTKQPCRLDVFVRALD